MRTRSCFASAGYMQYAPHAGSAAAVVAPWRGGVLRSLHRYQVAHRNSAPSSRRKQG